MAQSTYRNYIALKEKLKRQAKAHPVIGRSYSALATLCFETALKNNGFIPKESYYGTAFEQPMMSYTEWIAQLKRAGVFSSFSEGEQPTEKSSWIRFKPGPVTLPYINKEKMHLHEMASMQDLHELDARKADRSELEETKANLEATAKRLDETNKALAEIADAVRELQEASIPPDNAEKKKRREEATRKIALRACAN